MCHICNFSFNITALKTIEKIGHDTTIKNISAGGPDCSAKIYNILNPAMPPTPISQYFRGWHKVLVRLDLRTNNITREKIKEAENATETICNGGIEPIATERSGYIDHNIGAINPISVAFVTESF